MRKAPTIVFYTILFSAILGCGLYYFITTSQGAQWPNGTFYSKGETVTVLEAASSYGIGCSSVIIREEKGFPFIYEKTISGCDSGSNKYYYPMLELVDYGGFSIVVVLSFLLSLYIANRNKKNSLVNQI